MLKKKVSYDKQKLLALLTSVSGHLQMTSPKDERSIQLLNETLASVLPDEDITTIKNSFFSFENSDLFSTDSSLPRQLIRLQDIVSPAAKETGADLRVFVREVPVRSTQIKGSVPLWASGAAVEKTIGPFINKDGRKIWFDFFKVEQLIALYFEGWTDPAILFKIPLVQNITHSTLFSIIDSLKYNLMPDSVWINSKIFSPNAPTGLYTGLKIKQGVITLSAPPKTINGRRVISSNTTVTVKLDLDQPEGTDADPVSPYGIDARNKSLDLPKQLTFHFSSSTSTIDAVIGKAQCDIYGQTADFQWNKQITPAYDSILNRILIPLNCSENTFSINNCQSPFITFAGKADIQQSAWALPAAQIDVTKPLKASGIGGIVIQCKNGLTVQWKGLRGGEISLTNPKILCDVGRINITDLKAGNLYCNQEYILWKDDVNSFGSSIKLQYTNAFPFLYNSLANGNEALQALPNGNPLLDRPVTVSGKPFDIHSKNSTLVLAVNKSFKLIYLHDENILFEEDASEPEDTLPKPLALALHNALFKVTPVNGYSLFGELADDFRKVKTGNIFLTLGMYAYLPTLPDPYAADLNRLKYQFARDGTSASTDNLKKNILLWLICKTKWMPAPPEEDVDKAPPEEDVDKDSVDVSFHLAPLQKQLQLLSEDIDKNLSNLSFVKLFNSESIEATMESETKETPAGTSAEMKMMMSLQNNLPDYQAIWDRNFSSFQNDVFSLLDVSSNANQMGVSFGQVGGQQMTMLRTHNVVSADTSATTNQFPLQVKGLDVEAKGSFVRAFTVPQISWEPVLNRVLPEKKGDPPELLNYYPDDGGPTKITNNSVKFVPIAPISVSKFLVDAYSKEPDNIIFAYFTLPFGLRSMAYLDKASEQSQKPDIQFNRPSFEGDLKGGIQLQLNAGSGFDESESNMFRGYTMQMNNVLDLEGQKKNASTLGYDVSFIFNNNFYNLDIDRGVPLTRIDLSGYGASTFSNWVNKEAQFASTSQAEFNVLVGRCAHEVIQVRSILYPWGIKVVRTITLFRVGSGYVYRDDSGWKAESDGKFDFRFKYIDENNNEKTTSPYKIHPGVVKGLFNVENIRSATDDIQPFLSEMDISGFYILDTPGQDPQSRKIIKAPNNTPPVSVNLQPVYFDADVELENVVQGQVNGKVPSKKILGFVQLAPEGIPLTPKAFQELLTRQLDSIGGPLDCVIDIGNTGQKMRLNRFDVNNSTDETLTQPVFVVAVRGSVILPIGGSWSTVMHNYATGDVVPLPKGVSAPLIRIGELDGDMDFPDTELLRIANPADLLRPVVNETVNFGFLHNTNTQKVLFLTPAFQKMLDDNVPGKLLSKTPPLFADAYRIVSSKGIFPNISDKVEKFGDAIPLTGFNQSPLTDGGQNVYELMHINTDDGINKLKEDGYKLLKNVDSFDLPDTEWYLIKEEFLKIYVEYKAQIKNSNRIGYLNFDINSFPESGEETDSVEERWKSRLNNLTMIVDLGKFKRLLLIKGNFVAREGVEASYKGEDELNETDFPAPQIEFSEELKPVTDILQILEDLQGEKYGDMMKKGLKIAMSNSADSWEYKFEASKEIPLIRFPPGPEYESSAVPLKLEASMKVGMYFNAALTAVPDDPKKLLPTAGAFMELYGQLSVMCASISAGTVYAVGQVNLRLATDTKAGKSLDMKFGFGAQIVIGLPVTGNVSVLYLVGIEINIGSNELKVSAFMLFQGHAELLGGVVGVTISIEATGTISKTNDRTDCVAQVTFGLDISIFMVIDINIRESWEEHRQIA